jgi:hypothetical protein
VLLAVPVIVHAAGDQQLERQPLQELIRTEVVYPQERGEFQFTLGSIFDHGRSVGSFSVPIGIEYGLTDALQVRLGYGAFTRVHSRGTAISGLGDVSVGAKYSFMNIGGSRIHSAIGVDAARPAHVVLDDDAARGREIEPYAAFAADLNARGTQIFGSMAFAFASAERVTDGIRQIELEHDLQWNAGALVPLSAVTLATEFSVQNDRWTLYGAHEMYVTPSVTFRLASPWELGVGVPLGLTRESSRVALAVHVILEK